MPRWVEQRGAHLGSLDPQPNARLEVAGRPETRAQVVCDGLPVCELEPGLRLRVSRAPLSATLLHPPGHDYFRILRSKLHWGRSGRSGQPPAD